MVVVSYSGKEINAKVVYYGAGLSGKTTNLESIYEAVPDTSRGKMVSMKTQSDRTLFFDLLPLDLGEIMGFKTRFLLYTVPGQVFYNATRKLVLKGADAIVFVADSGVGKMDENKESLANLHANLAEYGVRPDEIPLVLQYNKRDLPEVYSMEELNRELNPDGKLPFFDAVATQGKGVFETFRGVSQLLMEKVTRELRRTPLSGAHTRPAKTEEGMPRLESQPAGTVAPGFAPSAPKEPREAAPVETVASAPGLALERGFGFGGEAPRAPVAHAGATGAAPAPAPAFAPPATAPRVAHGTGAPSSSPARPGLGESPAGTLGSATLKVPARAAGDSATRPIELVVPVVLPRSGTREILLKIILSEGG